MNRTRLPAVDGAGTLLRYRDTNLYVLPSRHWSIEFVLPALAVGLSHFDRICYELPASYDVTHVRQLLRDLGSCPGVILLPQMALGHIRIPESEDVPFPGTKALFLSSMLPVVPDSMITTLRAIDVLGPDAPEIEFIDEETSNAGEAERDRPRLPPMDPQEVADRGLEAWLRRWQPLIDTLPPPPADLAREAAMAHRLRTGALRKGGRTLFICGAAHWSRIRNLLDSDTDPPPPAARPFPMHEPRLVALDAITLYSWGFLDIPYVAGRFEQRFQQGATSFDRDAEIRQLVGQAYHGAGRAIHPRALVLMERYLRRTIASDACWSIDLDRHLLPAATAAVGESFRAVLERVAMRYPFAPPADVDEGRVLPVGQLGWGIVTPSEVHLVRIGDREPDPTSTGRPFRSSTPTRLSPHEERRLARPAWLHMKPGVEERQHKDMCDRARREAHLLVPRRRWVVTKPFRGSLRAGVDTRRTVAACARGDPKLHVFQRLRSRPTTGDCDLCPVVWVFNARSPIRHRLGDWFPDGDGRRVLYSSFFWFSNRTRIGPIWKNNVAFFVRLVRNVTPSWDRTLVERSLLDHLPADRRCNVEPWNDRSMASRFEGPDLAVACAVRWAMTDHIAVVRADPTWEIGSEIRAHAAEHGIELLEPAAGVFDPILLDRYQRDHEIPTRNPWTRPDPLFMRFVEPVPGFPEDDPLDRPATRGESAAP